MSELPDGIVTFLFTDVEGSTRMWETSPDLMMSALVQHDEAIDEAVAAHNGVSVKPRGEGDSRFIVFSKAFDALAAVAEIQRKLATIDWVTPSKLRVRASLHTGAADLQLGDYYGSAVNRAARLRGIAHGGQTVISRSTFELVQDQLPDGVTLTDMGQHRLKDLTRPEHVYQVGVEGLDGVFPPLVSLDAVPNNLPEQLTQFVGREADLAEAKRLLADHRLLTILAPGGTGKTRLAIQAAADLNGDYPNGVFFIALADISSGEEIVQTVAESLGLGLSSDQDTQTQLLTYLGNKRQLLVFDNFEHLRERGPLVLEILKAAPGVTVIATSRIKLNLTGETVLTLGGLDTSWDSAESALQASGARLFLDAAERSRSELALGPEDLEPLAKILRLTDGMPLGILLAAAWVDMLSVGEIAAEIEKSLDFLETDLGDVPDRQRSVRAVFDYTWKLLSHVERDTFAALSVFRGGFTRDAAEVVAGASLRNLSALASKSLLVPSPGTGRYAVHELLRQYAEAELETDRDRHDHVLSAHAAYYSGLTGRAFELMSRSDQPRLLATVEQDIDNVRMGFRHSLAVRGGDLVRNFVPALWFLYEVRGWYPSAVSLFDEALVTFDEGSSGEAVAGARAVSSAARAWFLTLLGRQFEGEAAAAAAVNTLRAGGRPEELWLALQCWALGLIYQGRIEEWVTVADEGIALGETLAEPFWAAVFKNWRGGAALMSGDFDTGKERLLEGMDVYQQIDEHYYLSLNLQHQAQAAMPEGRIEDAIDLLVRSVERGREIGSLRSLQMSLTALGDANQAAGHFNDADTAYVEALATVEQMGMVREMLDMLLKIATTRAASGSKAEAVELLATVLADPVSSELGLFQNVPIAEAASEALAELEADLDRHEYAAAHEVGSSRPFEVAVKELLDSSSD